MFEEDDGTIVVTLAEHERALVGQLPVLLSSVEHHSDPGYDMLHRAAYTADPVASSEYARLVEHETERTRIADRSVASDVAEGAALLSHEDARSLLRCINEARLVLAARSGAFELGAGWEDGIDDDPSLAVVAWLGHVQSELLTAVGSPG